MQSAQQCTYKAAQTHLHTHKRSTALSPVLSYDMTLAQTIQGPTCDTRTHTLGLQQ